MFKFSGVRVLGEGRLHTLWSRDSSWARERGNEGKTGRAGGQRSWWKEVSVGSTGLTVGGRGYLWEGSWRAESSLGAGPVSNRPRVAFLAHAQLPRGYAFHSRLTAIHLGAVDQGSRGEHCQAPQE